jgi:hypothetical protein
MYFILVKASAIWRVYIHDPNVEPHFIDEAEATKIYRRLIAQHKGKVMFKLVRCVEVNSKGKKK